MRQATDHLPLSLLSTAALAAGILGLTLIGPAPLGTPATRVEARAAGRASVHYIDIETGARLSSQTLTPAGNLRMPAGYRLIDASTLANVRTTIAAGYDTDVNLRVAAPATATVRYVTASGKIIATRHVAGYATQRQLVTPSAPSGYTLLNAATRSVVLSNHPAVTMTYRVAPTTTTSTVTFRYVLDQGTVERQVAASTITGVVGTSGQFAAQLPSGYRLAGDHAASVPYLVTARPHSVLIHLTRATKAAPSAPTKAKPATGMITISVIDADSGQVLFTQPIFGPVGQPVTINQAALLRRLGPAVKLVGAGLPQRVTFQATTQRLSLRVRTGATRNPLAKAHDLPATVAPEPSGHTLIARQLYHTAPVVHPTGPLIDTQPLVAQARHLPPVVVSRKLVLPHTITNDGGGGLARSMFAKYLIALSGKINYGIKA